MDSSVNRANIPNSHDFDSLFPEHIFEKITELPSLDNSINQSPLPYNNNRSVVSSGDINGFLLEDGSFDCFDHDIIEVDDNKTASVTITSTASDFSCEHGSHVIKDESSIDYDPKASKRRSNAGRKSSAPLELEEIQKYFGLPIIEAAKAMNVGLTHLKRRCREINISRWPHRKIKSLKTLIHNVKELGLNKETKMLEEHAKMVAKSPDIELTGGTKKLRQAYFKANYKRRKLFEAADSY